MLREGAKGVFVLEGNPGTREAIRVVLESEGYEVHAFGNSEECLDVISAMTITCNLLIMGLRVFPLGGLELIKTLRLIRPKLPVVVVTATGNVTLAVQSLKLGVYDFIEKPVKRDYLVSTVHKALATGEGEKMPLKSLLSKTEYEILLHILDGKSTKEISAVRHRSVRTIEDQRAAVMKKLEVDNLVDLVKRAADVVMPFD